MVERTPFEAPRIGTTAYDFAIMNLDYHDVYWENPKMNIVRMDPDQWLRAGEALERVWLEIARHGFVMSPLTQIAEVPAVRAVLRTELRMSTYPHILMRVGRAAPTAGVPRRHLDELLTDPTEPPPG